MSNAIFHAELDRLARSVVDLRAARAPWIALPLTILAALDLQPLRVLLLAMAGLGMFVVSKREPRRLAREGFSVRFISENARLLSILHIVALLTTGGLCSPLLPVLVVFPCVTTLVVGDDPSLFPYVLHQSAVVVFLGVGQARGWASALSPSWLSEDLGLAHTVIETILLLAMVQGAVYLGKDLRKMFERVMEQGIAAQGELLEAHRAQAQELTALSGAIAHELKNPLASVKGLAALLARDLQESKPRERLGVLRDEVDRMQGILEEFLTFSRPLVPIVVQPSDIAALCEEVAALHEGMARSRGQTLEVFGAGTAQADPRKTKQILINLVQNALEASPENSRVRIRIEKEGSWVRVRVEDEGPGPDPSLGERLFEAGVTTKASGNGLGLTIARALARQQGGEVELRKEGGGCAVLTLSESEAPPHLGKKLPVR